MKNLVKAILYIGVICLGLVFASCSDVEEDKDTKSYITLNASVARTVNPVFETDNLSDFVLTGSINGGEVKTLDSWKSLAVVKRIEVTAGKWDFTLSCKNGSASLKGTLNEVEIGEGENPLSFELVPISLGNSTSYGRVSVSINVPQNIKSVTAGLFDIENETEIPEFKIEKLLLSGSTAAYTKLIVPSGSYVVRFFMYADEKSSVLVNEYSEIVNVASEAESHAERTVEKVNEIYTITYDLVQENAKIKDGISYQNHYTVLSDVLLLSADEVEYADHVFIGWYDNLECSGTKISIIEAGTAKGNKTFYAKWAIQGNQTLEASQIAEKLATLDEGVYTIKATGPCSDGYITAIAMALKKRPELIITLDLSATNGLINIAENAFKGCTNLSEVILPVSVTTIGDGAFNGCNSLTSITIPFIGESKTATNAKALFGYIFGTTEYEGGTETVQEYAYNSKITNYIPTSLRKVTVLDGNVSYGSFDACKNLTSIILPSGLETIGNYAFRNCSNLPEILIPESVKTIGNYAFSGCEKFTSIDIPTKVTKIGAYVFQELSNLFSVNFADSTELTEIGSYAFTGCTSLTNIIVPDSVTKIGSSAFFGCSRLTEITIPFAGSRSGATKAEDEGSACLFSNIFGGTGTEITQTYYNKTYSSTSKETITRSIPTSLRKVTVTKVSPLEYAFSGITTDIEIILPETMATLTKNLFYKASGIKSIKIPDSVTTIDSYAFYGCSALESISIPDSVTTIGTDAFAECKSIKQIKIPESVTTISAYAFYYCEKLENINLPESINSIGKWAFYNCSSLKEIVIPKNVTKIDDEAFSYCKSLTKVVIPDSVTSIYSACFKGCSSLAEITLPFVGTAPTTTVSDNSMFGVIFGSSSYEGGVETAQSWTKWNSSGNSGTYQTAKCYIPESLKKVTITKTAPLAYSFSRISVDIEVVLPENMKTIPDELFYGARGLKSIKIPDSVTTIYSSAFSGCTGLESITIPNSVTTISSAFSGCTGLKTITIPDSVTKIDSYAFSGCTNLELSIPESVTSIGGFAFKNIKSVHFDNHTSTSIYGAKSLKRDYTITNINGATCTTPGSYDEICNICGKEFHHSDVILPHNFDEDGKCTDCGVEQLKVESTGSYKFTEAPTTKIWTSDNKNKSSSYASTTWKLNGISLIYWTVSSEENHDKLRITVDGKIEVDDVSGSKEGLLILTPHNEHTVKATYSKDSSYNTSSDCATLKFE